MTWPKLLFLKLQEGIFPFQVVILDQLLGVSGSLEEPYFTNGIMLEQKDFVSMGGTALRGLEKA